MFSEKRSLILVFIMFALLVLSSCKNDESSSLFNAYPVDTDNSIPNDTESDEVAYPPLPQPMSEAPESAYPIATPVSETVVESYPVQSDDGGILIQLDKPLLEGATTVTGVGPSGLPVSIMNVTMMGELLGSGVVDSNGKFSISTAPLPINTRIGVYVDLTPVGLTDADIQAGNGAMNIPLVGYFVDTAMVFEP